MERLGGGRSQKYRLRESDPLAQQIIGLFRAEHDRFQELLRRLREVFNRLAEIRTAWVDEWPGEVGQPLHIGLLADSAALTYLTDEVRQRIVGLEQKHDLTLEVHTFSRADVPEVDWARATLLGGEAPFDLHVSPGRTSVHSARTARAVAVSRVVAELLDHDPTLLRRAQRHLKYLLDERQGAASHDIREWQEILNHYSRERIKELLISDTPRAQRLRQSSPFFAVLNPDEREQILDQMAQHDA